MQLHCNWYVHAPHPQIQFHTLRTRYIPLSGFFLMILGRNLHEQSYTCLLSTRSRTWCHRQGTCRTRLSSSHRCRSCIGRGCVDRNEINVQTYMYIYTCITSQKQYMSAVSNSIVPRHYSNRAQVHVYIYMYLYIYTCIYKSTRIDM